MEAGSSSSSSALLEASTFAPQDMAASEPIDLHFVFYLNTMPAEKEENTYDDYEEFINKLRDVLSEHSDSEVVRGGRHVLAKQLYPIKPVRLIHVKLVGDNNETTTLAIRDDNVYLLGFQAQNETWYEFGLNQPGKKGKSMMNKTPDTTLLGWEGTYAALLEVVETGLEKKRLMIEKMGKLELGKKSVKNAVGILSRYDSAASGGSIPIGQATAHPVHPPDPSLAATEVTTTKRALASLILMFCEATRMIPFFSTVLASWDDMAEPYKIEPDQAKYAWSWGDTSYGLREWKKEGYRQWGPITHPQNNKTVKLAKDPIVGIKSAAHALRVAQLLSNVRHPDALAEKEAGKSKGKGKDPTEAAKEEEQGDKGNNKSYKGLQGATDDASASAPAPPREEGPPSNEGQQGMMLGFGRPLADVLRVRPLASVERKIVIGTVAAFDGKRGQVIYREPVDNSAPQSQGMVDLLLTGPYRAISAEGSFAIEVDASDESGKKAKAKISWDCYSDKAEYNKVITTDADSIAKVTYAVLSDAVEANVQVQLKLYGVMHTPGVTARVYGKITAHNQHYGSNNVPLFSRSKEEEIVLKLHSSSNGLANIPVPLARSVVATPFDMPLLLNIEMYAAFPPHDKFLKMENEEYVRYKQDVVFSLLHQHTGQIERNGVVVQVTSPHIYPRFPGMSSLHVCLDLDCRHGDYAAFIKVFREKLADHPGKASVHGRPVLAKQQHGKPARFFMITLAGDMNEKVTLAVRDDNLDVVGFQTQNGSWYEFGGVKGSWNSSMLPGSTFLGCTYGSLLGSDHVLQDLQLGRTSAMLAILTLSWYKQQEGQTVDQSTKLALLGLMVTLCGSARLATIYSTVERGWHNRTVITVEGGRDMVNWSEISRFLLGRKRLPEEVRNIMGINNEADAAELVELVRNPHRHLAEVFAASADSRFRGIFSVVDDQGSKAVSYENQRDAAAQGTIDLALIGPSRLVSADGKIHIQVDNISKDVIGDLLWDGPSDNNLDYNRIKTHNIIIGGFHARLTYVVHRDAVEASVKVQLKLKQQEAGTVANVYGKIIAVYRHFRHKGVVLFSRTSEEAIKLEDVISVPLLRDFLAASFDSVLEIKVRLLAVSSSYEKPISLDEDLYFDPGTSSDTREIGTTHMDAQVRVITAS